MIGGLVVIGASFGGFDALKTMLGLLPGSLPWPLAVVQQAMGAQQARAPAPFTRARPEGEWSLRAGGIEPGQRCRHKTARLALRSER